MMAVRERAAAVMAALDRRVPNLDDYLGQSWSSWIERANVFTSDGSDVEECLKNGKKKVETMTLRREDMSIFGHCPSHDNFYLVVCSHCGQVVKPQAFERHCEKRHGPFVKLYGSLHSSPSASLQRPRHGHSQTLYGASQPARDGRYQSAGPPRALSQPLPPTQYRHTKFQRDGVSFSPLDKVSQTPSLGSSESRQPPPSGSPPGTPAPGLKDPSWPQETGLPARPLSSEKSLLKKGDPGPLRGPKTYKKVSRKECDLDKHCGVLDAERKKLCTRLLTCNKHSIHQRRKVLGRSKTFDQLVAELKMGPKVRERAVLSREGGSEGSPHSPKAPGEQMRTPDCRRHLAGCATFRSRTPLEGGPEEDSVRLEEEEMQPLSPLTHCRLSSEESEGEGQGQEEPADWQSTPWHPKPLGLCSFGSRALGCGVFTFDRRLHHLRSAVSTMVENHLNTHLWKKIPQVIELQCQRTSSTCSSAVNTARGAGGHSNASTLRTSSSSSGAGRETWPQNCSASLGLAGAMSDCGSNLPISPRPQNFMGRPGKQQALSAGLHKKRGPPQDESSTANDRNCVLQERGRTAPSPQGPTNGALSVGSKTCSLPVSSETHSSSPGRLKRAPPPIPHPPPDPSPRGKGASTELRGEAAGHEYKAPGKKRKGSGLTPPKPHRPPAASHSGFFSWRKDGKGGGLTMGLERKLSVQKPKLHH